MITNFKIQAIGETQEEVQDQLEQLAVDIIGRVSPGNGISWECTAEIVTGSRQEGYKGRISFVYRGEDGD